MTDYGRVIPIPRDVIVGPCPDKSAPGCSFPVCGCPGGNLRSAVVDLSQKLESAYYDAKITAELFPTIENMRAAVAAFDRWQLVFQGTTHG